MAKTSPASGAGKDKQAGSMSDRARKKLEEQLEQEALQRQQTLLRKRLDLAHGGVRHLAANNISEAVKSFQTYLKVLELWKRCGEGGLKPELFDHQADLAELLLISGIYWDLLKLYDKTDSPSKLKEFRQYMDKFILFTKGMPYAGLCTETLRKYIANEKTRHTSEFKTAYKALGGQDCFVVSAVLDDIDFNTYIILRNFRDLRLRKFLLGRGLIQCYQILGPLLATFVNILPRPCKRLIGWSLDLLAIRITGKKVQSSLETIPK